MTILTYIFIFIFLTYITLIIRFIYGFQKLNSEVISQAGITTFSIVIPFRNEEKNLPNLLDSIQKISYSAVLFEIIFIDDESSDNSVKIIREFSEKSNLMIHIKDNRRVSNSPKKDALSIAITEAKYKWIITTDADCVVPEKWLQTFNDYIIKHQPKMLVAPVTLIGKNRFLEQFQIIDFLSMQGATIGGFGINKPFMANGANLCYQKEVFLTLDGFSSNNEIASGDDVFLLEDFLKHDKKSVHFIKNTEALVKTFVQQSWSDLINQRKRWAAKAPKFNNNFTKLIGIFVFLSNIGVLIAFLISIYNPILLWLVILKFIVDSILIFKTAKFYKQSVTQTQYIKTLFFYPFFTTYIAVVSLLTKFSWKDRIFKQ